MKSRTRFRPSQVSADASIDATPVMNMFVILIPFLVSMAAFSQLAVQRLALPGNEAADVAQTEEDAPLLVSVTSAELLAMRGNRVVGRVERSVPTQESTTASTQTLKPASSSRQEPTSSLASTLRAELAPLIEECRRSFPGLDHLTLALADDVVCADVVTCFDVCRETGFVDVGVAEATK
ncbi:MAG: biopolymer transporter ExbD [Candidatus Eisenbacteria bacterium]